MPSGMDAAQQLDIPTPLLLCSTDTDQRPEFYGEWLFCKVPPTEPPLRYARAKWKAFGALKALASHLYFFFFF